MIWVEYSYIGLDLSTSPPTIDERAAPSELADIVTSLGGNTFFDPFAKVVIVVWVVNVKFFILWSFYLVSPYIDFNGSNSG